MDESMAWKRCAFDAQFAVDTLDGVGWSRLCLVRKWDGWWESNPN